MRAPAPPRRRSRASRPANAARARAARAHCRRARGRFRRMKSRCPARACRERFAWPGVGCYTIRLLPVTRGIRSMTSVRVRDNEPFEVALRRFKRTIEKTGLLTELRAREFYEKPTAERKRKLAAAVKRHYKRLRSQQLPPKLY